MYKIFKQSHFKWVDVQDEIELELAAKEKEVEESERNVTNYEQTLIVRSDQS